MGQVADVSALVGVEKCLNLVAGKHRLDRPSRQEVPGSSLRDKDACVKVVARERLIQLTHQVCDVLVAPGRTFLVAVAPVVLWLVDGRDVRNVVALLGEVFSNGSQVFGKIVVAVIFEVGRPQTIAVAGSATLGILHGSRVAEEQDVFYTILLGLAHEVLLPACFAPVITGAVAGEEALGAAIDIANEAGIALLGTAATQVHTPVAQPDALGVAATVKLL